MSYITPYRVVYTRIGTQESWAGWTIAGYSEGTPNEVLHNCSKLQARNSDKAKFMFDKVHKERRDDAREVYEFFCDYGSTESKVFTFTKMLFGDSDESGRTGMSSASVCVPLFENEEILKKPQTLLTIDRECFDDCKLNTELLAQASGKNHFSIPELQTRFEPKKYVCKDSFDVGKAVSELFGSKKAYENLIKCIYWNLTFNSSSSIFICTDGDLDKEIRLFLTIFNSVLYSFRTKLSFRTFDFADANTQPTLVFCRRVPNGVKYYDIRTGNNNILTDSIMIKLNRSSMNYYPQNVGKPAAEKYFDLFEQTLDELGNRSATDVGLLETAFVFVQNELEGQVAQSDKELVRKLITVCNLPYNNEKIDGYIAGLLETVIENDIPLNDDIRSHIDKKLSVTSCKKLIEAGIRYNAKNLLSEPKEKAYERLYRLKESDASYEKVIEYIKLEPKGKSFIDRFFGEYYGPAKVRQWSSLMEFAKETADVTPRVSIEAFLKNCCEKLGESIVLRFFSTGNHIDADLKKFGETLRALYPNSATPDEILRDTCVRFWENAKIPDYDYSYAADYRLVACSNPRLYPSEAVRKSNLFGRLTEIYGTAAKCNPNTVRGLKNKLEETDLTSAEQRRMLLKFRDYCLDHCDTADHLDFWIALAELDPRSKFEFIFNNRIRIFCNENSYESALIRSSEMNDAEKLGKFRLELEAYRRLNDTKTAAAIWDITRRREAELRKKQKHEKKRPEPEKKQPESENKRKEPDRSRDIYSSSEPQQKRSGGERNSPAHSDDGEKRETILKNIFNKFKKN